MGVEYKCCDMEFYKRILIVVLLLMFAGLMSGLTLGLMSLSLVDLEVLAKSGTPQDRNNAGNFSPCLMEHHHLLDFLLGHRHKALFHRAELKTLVYLHGHKIKNVWTIDPEDEAPVKSVTICRIARVPETMPLYDILNEFQKGHSHMAIVVKHCGKTGYQSSNNNAYDSARDAKVDIDGEKPPREKKLKTKMSCHKWKSFPNPNNLKKGSPQSRKWSKNMYSDILEID
ncbi:hypothetical protein JHK85_038019 [Glycine max]|nr:hypothetical protein JHK85_038019 [Glycine max]